MPSGTCLMLRSVRPSTALAAALRMRDESRRTRDGAGATKKLAGVGALPPSLHKFHKILNMQVANRRTDSAT